MRQHINLGCCTMYVAHGLAHHSQVTSHGKDVLIPEKMVFCAAEAASKGWRAKGTEANTTC